MRGSQSTPYRGRRNRIASREEGSERAQRYLEYIESSEWQAVRKRYRDSKLPWECAVCGTSTNLHLHHRTYKRLGRERLSDLVPLCKFHHKETHRIAKTGVQLWDAHRKVSFKPTVLPPQKGRKHNKPSKQKPAALIRLKKTKQPTKPKHDLWCSSCRIKYPRGYMKLRCQCGNIITHCKT